MAERGCEVDGCEQDRRTRRFCGTHYQRNRRHGSPTAPVKPRLVGTLLERLEHYSKAIPETGCIEWTGARTPKGYGMVADGSARGYMYAHRAALSEQGVDIEGRVVRHAVCDNPPCINPDHLAPGDYADNNRDRYEKQRFLTGLGPAGRHAVYVEYSICRPEERRVAYRLAEKYGLTYGTILKYVRQERKNKV